MPRLSFAVACIAGLLVSAAHAAYPDRPVMLVAPFPPGGSVDLIARPLAVSMEKLLKQPIVVTNKTGAAGDPLFRAAMDKMITPVQYQDMPEFEKFMAGEEKLLAQVVRKIGRVEDKK
jgi:hypothetical protein